MENMREIIDELLEDSVYGHSEFQLEQFVVDGDARLTPYSHYVTRLNEIRSLSEILKRAETDLAKGEHEIAILEFELAERKEQLAHTDRRAKRIRREVEYHVTKALGLKKEIGEIDPAERKELDRRWFTDKALKKFAIDMMTTHNARPSRSTLHHMSDLPRESLREIMLALKKAKFNPEVILGTHAQQLLDFTDENKYGGRNTNLSPPKKGVAVCRTNTKRTSSK